MNSFEIVLKDDRGGMETLVTRALLVIAAVAAYVYAGEWNFYAGLGLSALLLVSSFFVKTILYRFKVNGTLLLGLAALLTFVTSHSIGFALVLVGAGLFLHFMKRKIKVEVSADAIVIRYALYMRQIRWNELNNVVLKDRMLTIDFKTDKLIQAEIAKESYQVDEPAFNSFCDRQLPDKN
jgi:hypothetical protein